MKKLIHIIFLFLLYACSPTSNDKKNNSNNEVLNPIFNSNINFIQEYYINDSVLELSLEDYLYDNIRFYSDELCSTEITRYTNKIIQFDDFQLNNDDQIFFYKQEYNNQITDCQFAFKISHNNQVINSYTSNYWDTISGTTVNNLLFQIEDVNYTYPNRIESISIYEDFNQNNLILSASIEDYINSNIFLPLKEDAFNFFYFVLKDKYGNVSNPNPVPIILEHETLNIPSIPSISLDLLKNPYYIDNDSITISGSTSSNTTNVKIYNESNVLLYTITPNELLNGFEVPIIQNTSNIFRISAINLSGESNFKELEFIEDSIIPNIPILDSEIQDLNNQSIDFEDSNVIISGQVDDDVEYIAIYDNPELINNPVLIIERDDFINKTTQGFQLGIGQNNFYIVAIDYLNRQSNVLNFNIFVIAE